MIASNDLLSSECSHLHVWKKLLLKMENMSLRKIWHDYLAEASTHGLKRALMPSKYKTVQVSSEVRQIPF